MVSAWLIFLAGNLDNLHGVLTPTSTDRCAHMSGVFTMYLQNVLDASHLVKEKTLHSYREDVKEFLGDFMEEDLFKRHPDR
jgi:hypothetical protein